MKSYDKAAWHIDGGEDSKEVVCRFRQVFEFLLEKNMLTEDGKETLEYGMDSSVSLNSTMVTEKGKLFLDNCYDQVIKKNVDKIKDFLSNEYMKFVRE